MGDRTGIEWADSTWNPVTGCDAVSPGCDNCYAETLAERFRGTPGHYFEHGFDVQLRPDKLDMPLRWTRPRRIFVNSMSDLFHDLVPDWYVAQVFAVMAQAPQHTFQVLTKRHGRMRSLVSGDLYDLMVRSSTFDEGYRFKWPLPNVWLGVSAEDQKRALLRIPALFATPAAVRFVSAEPLLGPVVFEPSWLKPQVACARWTRTPTEADHAALDEIVRAAARHANADKGLGGSGLIDWVIVGGESGRNARPMHPVWVRNLRNQCFEAGTPFLFKQWGEFRPTRNGDRWEQMDWVARDPDEEAGRCLAMTRVGKKAAGRDLDGRTWDEYPRTLEAADS